MYISEYRSIQNNFQKAKIFVPTLEMQSFVTIVPCPLVLKTKQAALELWSFGASVQFTINAVCCICD